MFHSDDAPFLLASRQRSLWTALRRIAFRILAFFILLRMPLWNWLGAIPGMAFLRDTWWPVDNWVVYAANRRLFHVREVLVPMGGSGDTSFGWAQLWTHLLLAVAGGLLWTALDRRRRSYRTLHYWLLLYVRYFVAVVSFSYGFSKVFLLQMPAPGYSRMATQLGDMTPMGLSWTFIGYSAPYEAFSGLMEVAVGALLLWRRTATLGAMLGTAVYANVMMLNLSYDIPVKIFSTQLFLSCIFLLAAGWKRIWYFFVLNRPVPACNLYERAETRQWKRIGRVVMKALFIVQAAGVTASEAWDRYTEREMFARAPDLVKPGLYDVVTYAVNGDTVSCSSADTLRWRNVAFDKDRMGSIATGDTAFFQLNGRGYFRYTFDTAARRLVLKNELFRRWSLDTLGVARFRYSFPDTASLSLHGTHGADTLDVLLRRSTHRFPLAERPFHWITEERRR